jgi:glycosyltransferase involved in cell wall biosynthesis
MQEISVFRTELLPLSETFVAGQAGAMRRFSHSFAGLRRVPGGIPLDPEKAVTLTAGDALRDRLHRRFFVGTGLAPRFSDAIRERHPALIHAHFAVDAAVALPIQRRLDIPMVVSLHGYDVTSKDDVLNGFAPGRAYLRRRSELQARASLFICDSDHIRSVALERGFPDARLRTHPIGVDLDAFQADPQTPREPIVLFVGRLVEKKGCAHLIDAMALVQERQPEAQLIIVGDGPLREALRSKAGAGLRRCTFLGAQPSSAVRGLMRRASLIVVPSIVASSGDTEGLPIVLCEAQAMSLAIAGFRGPGTSEAVSEGETALLVEPGDHRALAEAISGLLADPALAARIGAAGRRRVERFFSLAAQTALLEERFAEILS